MNNFSNRNAVTKISLSSHNRGINTTKWYNLQGDLKILKNCERNEIENEIHMIFSCDKYDNIRRKGFNDINEVDNIKLQIGNKREILKLFCQSSKYIWTVVYRKTDGLEVDCYVLLFLKVC